MGMSGIDEKAMMLQALEEVAGVTKLPLSIDSSHVDIIEAALRIYPGIRKVRKAAAVGKKIRRDVCPFAAIGRGTAQKFE